MQWYHINTNKVAHETIEGETIIINFDTGAYYSTDQLGMEIWEMLSQGATLTGVTETIVQNYSGERAHIEAALRNFMGEMVNEGLVVTVESAEMDGVLSQSPAGTAPAPFQLPVLRKYTDMQDLLLLDPIHEVEAQGWPYT
jgi:hypothetical protein